MAEGIILPILYRLIGGFFLIFVSAPASIILLGYLIYIVANVVRELKK